MTHRIALLLGLIAATPAPAPGADPPSTARAAVAPLAPAVPPEVVAAMQEGRFDDAAKRLAAWAAEPKADAERRAYASLAIGVARRVGGRLDEAREVLTTALKASPAGVWAPKLRAELAAVEVAAGRFDRAEALARAEAETLLADDRKDKLANVYRAFADKLMAPGDPVVAADPAGAHALLTQARELAKGDPARASLLLAMIRASQAAGDNARAITESDEYVKTYPKGADAIEARYHRAESLLATGQAVAARLAREDLIRLARPDDSFRRRATYELSRTYGIPNAPDDAQNGLGVAVLRRFLREYPADRLAVRAAYEIGVSYLSRGKSQDALDAFDVFLKGRDYKAEGDDARKLLAELSMDATFKVAQVLQGRAGSTTPSGPTAATSPSSPTARGGPTPSGRSWTPGWPSPRTITSTSDSTRPASVGRRSRPRTRWTGACPRPCTGSARASWPRTSWTRPTPPGSSSPPSSRAASPPRTASSTPR